MCIWIHIPQLEAREISAKRTFIDVDHVIFAFGVVCSNSSREIERSLLNPCKMFYSSDFSPTSSECESEISLVNELVEFDSCSNSVQLLATEEETSSRMQREFVLKRLNKGAVSAPIFSRASSEWMVWSLKWNLYLNFSNFRMIRCIKLTGNVYVLLLRWLRKYFSLKHTMSVNKHSTAVDFDRIL